jgi:hypothetical protein
MKMQPFALWFRIIRRHASVFDDRFESDLIFDSEFSRRMKWDCGQE